MTVAPVPLFIFLTQADSAYISDSSLNIAACQTEKNHDRELTGLLARSTKSHGTIDSALKQINWEIHEIWTKNFKSLTLKLQKVSLSTVETENEETEQFQVF